MLFLYRPRQTWMPYRLPRNLTQQTAYNRQMQDRFDSTRRVAPPQPATASADEPEPRDTVAQLKDLAALHAAGSISDDEFAAAKAKVLGAAAT